MNYMNFSCTDLQKVLGFEINPENTNKEDLDKLLWNLGMDVEKGYEWNHCLHRALSTNIPQDGYRIEGYERLDPIWINSGYASLDAVIASSKDESLRFELRSMNPHGSTLDSEYDATEHNLPEGELISFEEEDVVVDVVGNEGDCV